MHRKDGRPSSVRPLSQGACAGSGGRFRRGGCHPVGRAAGPLVVNRRGVIAHVQILSQLERFDDALALIDRSFGNEADPLLDDLRQKLAARTVLPFDLVATARGRDCRSVLYLAAALNGEAEDSYTLMYARRRG